MQYFRCAEMQQGHGWRCPNCQKLLAVKIQGNCLVQLSCPRCKAYISIKLKEPVNWNKKTTEPDTKTEGASV